MTVILLIIVVLIGIVAVGAASIRVPMFVQAKCKLNNNNEILLTFDDGPSENTEAILEILKRNNIHTVFFLIGKNIEKYPPLVKKITDSGHIVGNHTYEHNPFNAFRSENVIFQDIKHCEDLMNVKLILFRPPLGITNPAIARAIKRMNYRVLGWSLRSYDTYHVSREKIFRRVARKLKGGDIILLHDRVNESDVLLKKIINLAQSRGLAFADPHKIIEQW